MEKLWMAAQGDILLIRLPADTQLTLGGHGRLSSDQDDKIVLALGEATGHAHSILNRVMNPAQFRDTHEHGGAMLKRPASLFQDPILLRNLDGIIADPALTIGFLKVDEPVTLDHDEHGSIALEPGLYYAGRQRSLEPGAAAHEARIVAD